MKEIIEVFFKCINIQGSQRLEKYLNLEGFHEKSLKIKYALKSTGNHAKALNSSVFFNLL